MENTQDTPNFVPRLVGETEARQLGVAGGWYGTKMSGTFVTGPSASLEACIAAIDLLPKPPKVILTPPVRPIKSVASLTDSAQPKRCDALMTLVNMGEAPQPAQ